MSFREVRKFELECDYCDAIIDFETVNFERVFSEDGQWVYNPLDIPDDWQSYGTEGDIKCPECQNKEEL